MQYSVFLELFARLRIMQENNSNFTYLKGIITSCEETSGRYCANLENNSVIRFHSTTFQSNIPTRFPFEGEWIIATYQDDRLISVRSLNFTTIPIK
jgi:hypothetical protein